VIHLNPSELYAIKNTLVIKVYYYFR